jgi:CheY-like chemotaxis protein
MDKALRILALEDNATDLLLIDPELRKGGLAFHSKRVETRADFVRELEQNPPDVIVSDHGLPAFDGYSALAIAQQKCPEVPFLFVTGSQEEQVALDMFKSGATGLIPKNRLSHLVPAVQRALQLVEERTRRRKAEQAVREEPGTLPTTGEALFPPANQSGRGRRLSGRMVARRSSTVPEHRIQRYWAHNDFVH